MDHGQEGMDTGNGCFLHLEFSMNNASGSPQSLIEGCDLSPTRPI